MRRIRSLLGVIVAISLVAISILSAAVPGKVAVQGRLTTSAGATVPDGNYMITFSLWDDPVAGTMLASEIQNVSVGSGLFTVTLQFDGDKFVGDSSRYLQYQIQGDPPITPRILMTSTPYSLISSRVSGDIETGEGQLKVRRGSVSASNFRMVSDDDADLFNVETKPDSVKINIRNHIGGGDPDFDLLRIIGGTGNSGGTQVDGGMIAITGDPDFDLLRLTATQDSAKIRISGQSSGDPDFDLLTIVGGVGSTSQGAMIRMSGDPDFDMLTMRTGVDTPGGVIANGCSVGLTGDPDFDLLRLTATQDSAKIRISGQSSGDPDFDLLRIVGGVGPTEQGASIAIGGDPDFDLLRIQGSSTTGPGTVTGTSSINITGDPDFDLLRLTATQDSVKIRISGQSSGDPDFDLLRIVGGVGSTTQGASISMGGDPDFDLLRINADADSASVYVGSAFTLDATKSTDDEVVRTFSWRQTGGPWVLQMEQRADSAGSSALYRGLRGYDVILISDQNGAKIQVEDSADNVTGELNGEGRLGVGKPADNLKRIDVIGGAFCNGTNWVNASDVNAKENFSPVDANELLEKLAQLDITEWNYRGEGEDARHIGPTAQDFYKLFGTGNDDKSISTIDPAGISLAAIKELYRKSKEVDQLKRQVDDLSRQLLEIHQLLNSK